MGKPTADKPIRTLTPDQMARWAKDPSAVMRLRTYRDVGPGGYMAASIPTLVDWPASAFEGDAPFAVVRHVNYGGNPLERTTVLHSVRIPLDGVEFAEFTLVPLLPMGRRSLVQHGHLRLVFHQDRRPVLLSLDGRETGADAHLDDLVFSWEPWHPPGQRLDFVKALDDRFELSMRTYAGSQRYLEDVLVGREWYGFRLRLPGGAAGLRELLQVILAVGDGAARDTLSRRLAAAREIWLGQAPPGAAGGDAPRAEWRQLEDYVQPRAAGGGDAPALPDANEHYQTLLRSCAGLARYSVLLAARRLVDRGLKDGVELDRLPAPTIGSTEPWMKEAASANLGGLFLRAPAALRFILKNLEAIPKNIPGELDAAGLLERRRGKRWEIRYSSGGIHPYTSGGVNRDLPGA